MGVTFHLYAHLMQGVVMWFFTIPRECCSLTPGTKSPCWRRSSSWGTQLLTKNSIWNFIRNITMVCANWTGFYTFSCIHMHSYKSITLKINVLSNAQAHIVKSIPENIKFFPLDNPIVFAPRWGWMDFHVDKQRFCQIWKLIQTW